MNPHSRNHNDLFKLIPNSALGYEIQGDPDEPYIFGCIRIWNKTRLKFGRCVQSQILSWIGYIDYEATTISLKSQLSKKLLYF